ncbi:MAG: iron-sulfur cluster repair di-iron protein [Bacteroidetes bacterium 24-39-8]|jgi:regulator of cell morphogenesis and NO signaling|nr:MAG: iron-sulfur cluster repair di-iron protein [Bacteroidetes bacterium 24-39-8]HQR94576.1 iron-sulfur cluster repair di-iron protein [Sediminibacterium sp.]HQS55100.1 iron-sulfur cluster repair di-iron protein [Sediminibacterium sp.]
MNTENSLDVTLLEPRLKHPTIFDRYDQLLELETLTIHNDHDPKPLYYQLLAERGNGFSWEYLEKGPIWWIVAITKNAPNTKDPTLGELAASDMRKALLLRKNGLDFCCGGKKTLKNACAEKGIDSARIEEELSQIDLVGKGKQHPFQEWKPDFLADYIVNTHHHYVRNRLPELRSLSEKVAKRHGEQHPELLTIQELIKDINTEMQSHMVKEEMVLFPYVKALTLQKNLDQTQFGCQFGTVQNPINMMEMEHEVVGEHLQEIRNLTKNFTLPASACKSYQLLYAVLEEFEEDLHMHVHLENNILFPKALAMEKAMSKN